MKWSRAYTSLMEIITEAFSPLYPRAFIIVINSLDSPDNMLTNNALYPWRASVGKDKQSLRIGISIRSAKFKHKRNAIMQHQPCPGAMRQSSNYIRSGFLSNLLCFTLTRAQEHKRKRNNNEIMYNLSCQKCHMSSQLVPVINSTAVFSYFWW